MSDRFLLQANCSACGTDLNQEDEYSGQRLFMPGGDSIDLTCPKCGTEWRCSIDVMFRQKKLKKRKLKKVH